MRGVTMNGYGGLEVLGMEEIPTPAPREPELLVEVGAAGVNPVDWKIREGYLQGLLDYRFPVVPGWECAGVVKEAGGSTKRFRPGDPVYAMTDFRKNGCYAEYVAVKERHVAAMPRNLTTTEAASLPLVGLTAWQALVVYAGLAKEMRVLVHGGAGGVGSFAIQLAKAFGAYVATTCSTANVPLVDSLGADRIVDYTKSDFDVELHDYDVVLDTLGGEVYRRSFRVLRQGQGCIVSLLEQPNHELAEKAEARCGYVSVQPDGEQLEEIAKLVEDRLIRPVVTDVLPLEEAGKAQELSRSGHHAGKIVLEVKAAGLATTLR
jgi:NADPH:quinone reductase-like Zn-dependent oxidoreductase